MPVYYPRAMVRFTFILDERPDALAALVLPPGWEKLFVPVAENALGIPGGLRGYQKGYVLDIPPQRVRVTCNDYQEADEAEATFDFKKFPFDPRITRGITMEVHMGAVAGIDEKLRLLSPVSQIFIGYADEGEWRLSDDDSTISVTARDNTAIIHGRPYSGKQLDLRKSLRELITSILQEDASTAKMTVVFRGDADGSIMLADIKGDVGGQAHSGETTQSAWEVITHLCLEAGLICWVERDTIVVGPSQTIVRAEGPVFVYGQNLKRVTVKKKIGWDKTPPVTVTSWNPVERKTIAAVWPKQDKPPTQGTGKPGPPDGLLYVLTNVKDREALERAAKNIWTRRKVQDVSLDFDTAEMRGLDGEDLLRLRAGMPLRVRFTREEQEFLYDKPLGSATQYLIAQGYPWQVAAAIAGAYQDITPQYQVKAAEHTFDETRGYSLRVKAVSFIRAD